MRLSKRDSDIIKGVAILLMVAHHLFAFPEKQPVGIALSHVVIFGIPLDVELGNFGKICVALFFLLSGYAMGTKVPVWSRFPEQIGRRLKAFYLLFWINCAVLLTAAALLKAPSMPVNNTFFAWDLKHLLLNLSLAKTSYSGEWWFGRAYVLCIVLVWPLLELCRRLHIGAAIAAGVGLFLAGRGLANPLGVLGELLFWQAFFTTGFVLADDGQADNPLSVWAGSNRWKAIVVSIVLVVVLVVARHLAHALVADVVLAPLMALTALMLVHGLRVTVAVSFLGKISAHMWLNHTFFFFYLFPRTYYSLRHPVLIFAAALASSVGLAVLTHWIAEKLLRPPAAGTRSGPPTSARRPGMESAV